MSYFYTGVGSRRLPGEIVYTLTNLARYLKTEGFVLRSGGAIGADSAFEAGVGDNKYTISKQIFTSQHWSEKSMEIASQFHPNWQACNNYAKKLHSRNVKQVLGENLDTPSQFLICWTPEAETIGGTAIAIKVAQYYQVPVFNLGNIENIKTFFKYFHQTFL